LAQAFLSFLKAKVERGAPSHLWSLLILSPYSLVTLVILWFPVLKLSKGNPLIKRIPLLFIPIVIYIVERDVVFTLFGLLTSLLFFLTSYYKKDDFVEYGIFHEKQKNK
jgi:hypothetical protein